MHQLMNRSLYPISVDSVIFGFIEGKLKVALVKRKKPPFVGLWAIPGGFMEEGETVEDTALRELHEETGIKDVYLEQFGVYSKPGRDPRGPTITVALFALINAERSHLVATEDAEQAKWWPAYEVPKLAFDHDRIYENSLDALRRAIKTRPLAFELLPVAFTLSQLQELYEQVYGVAIDKRNFRKKALKMDFIRSTGKQTKGGRHRPALLYRYDAKRYRKYAKDNLF